MNIAVTAEGPDLDSRVDPRFGRCAHFVFVNPEDMSFEAVKNQNATLGGGAGIQSAQLVSEKGAEAVITGNCGPNAYGTLSAAGIQIVTGAVGTVREAVEAFKSGALKATGEPNVQSHFGTGGGQGMGGGRGMGGGQGMGGGRGIGGGQGRGR